MKIIVCLKHVPPNDGSITLTREMDWIHEGDMSFEVGEADACALEEALLIKAKLGGEVVALSLGPDRAAKCLKDALAKGADSAIHIVCEDAFRLSPYALAKSIAAIVVTENADLVVTGTQSNDRGNGQLAPNLAQALGYAHACMIVGVAAEQTGFTITRELEGGRAQKMHITTPCVLAIQSGINKPRYASMKGIMAAKKKSVSIVEMPSVDAAGHEQLLTPMQLFIPTQSKSSQVLDGGVDETVMALSKMLSKRKVVG